MDVYQIMREKNITLPEPPPKGGVYAPCRIVGNVAYISGCGCVIGEPKTDGAKITLVGSELTLPDGLRIEPGSMINAEALAGLVKSE